MTENNNSVQQYTLVDPKNLFVNYENFANCDEIPVAVQTSNTGLGWTESIRMPQAILPFLRELKNTPYKEAYPQAKRTISIINLAESATIIVTPNLQNPAKPILTVSYKNKNANKHEYVLHMTQNVRHILLQQIRAMRGK